MARFRDRFKRWPCVLMASSGLVCLPTTPSLAEPPHLELTTEQLPPLNLTDDDGKTVRGVAADKVHELMRRSGIAYKMELMSWNRAIEMAKRQPDTCVFSTARTAEREAKFKWVGPIANGEWVMYGPAEKLNKITNLEQVKGTRIGGYLGDAAGRYLEEFGYKVVISYGDDVTIKNLLAGRLDYWISSRKAAQVLIADNHAEGRIVPLFHVRSVEYFLACNPTTNDSVLDSLRVSLKQINADGTYDKIEAKY